MQDTLSISHFVKFVSPCVLFLFFFGNICAFYFIDVALLESFLGYQSLLFRFHVLSIIIQTFTQQKCKHLLSEALGFFFIEL